MGENCLSACGSCGYSIGYPGQYPEQCQPKKWDENFAGFAGSGNQCHQEEPAK